MTKCFEMKKDQIYVCEGCGLELRVVNECTECTSACKGDFICCGEILKLKK